VSATPVVSGPLISVVVTCSNLGAYIGEAIRSVEAQAFDQPFEIIVVDDCSTDDSDEIIRSFDRVRAVRTSANGGVLMAMLEGVRAAQGDIICFLDGDDLWQPDKLALVHARFDRDPRMAFVTHDLSFIDASGAPIPRATRPAAEFAALGDHSVDDWLRDGILMLSDHVWLGSAFAVRRSLIDFDGFDRFARTMPDPRNTYQDWPLAYWIAAQPGLRLEYVPQKLLRYRLHGANHSGDASTVAKALRNLQRTLNTAEAHLAIGQRFGVPLAARRRTEQQRAHYRYLIYLYGGQRPSFTALGQALGFVAQSPRLVAREVLRYAGVRLLGPQRFAALAARRR